MKKTLGETPMSCALRSCCHLALYIVENMSGIFIDSINLSTVFRINCVTRPMPLFVVRCRTMLFLSGRLLFFLISLTALNIRSSAVFTSIPGALSVEDLQ